MVAWYSEITPSTTVARWPTTSTSVIPRSVRDARPNDQFVSTHHHVRECSLNSQNRRGLRRLVDMPGFDR